MKYLYWAVLIIVVILSAAAGGAKLFSMPQEIALMQEAGLSDAWLLPHGCLQLVSAILAIIPRTRKYGGYLMAIGFLMSTIIIFLTSNAGFGAFSLLPVLMSLWIGRQTD